MTWAQRRVLLVEDDSFIAALVTDVLTAAGFGVERTADVLTALQVVRDFDPDAAILDISLGDGPSGLDLAHVLSRQHPHVAILFLTRHPDPRTVGLPVDSLPRNAGFLRKDRISDTGYLVQALEAVLGDRPNDIRDDQDPAKPLGSLSQHQLEILRLMACGYTNEAMARRKQVTLKTVERREGEIFKAMDLTKPCELNPRVEAIRRFIAAAGIPDRSEP